MKCGVVLKNNINSIFNLHFVFRAVVCCFLFRYALTFSQRNAVCITHASHLTIYAESFTKYSYSFRRNPCRLTAKQEKRQGQHVDIDN